MTYIFTILSDQIQGVFVKKIPEVFYENGYFVQGKSINENCRL